MLEDALKTQLHGYLQYLRYDIILQSSLLNDKKSLELRHLLDEIASFSPKITHQETYHSTRSPSFVIKRCESDVKVGFAGLPLGHEFESLILALLQVGGHPTKLTEEQIKKIKAINEPLAFETYFSLSCHICPEIVQILNMMSILNPLISHHAIDGGFFPQEVSARDIRSVPHVFLNGKTFSVGEITLERILKKLYKNVESEAYGGEDLSQKEPYDILIVGAGPAGIAAAVYAARKGLRLAVIGEYFGGQVRETLAIENFISAPSIVGSTLIKNMAEHLAYYHIEVLSEYFVHSVLVAKEKGGLHKLILSNQASLKAKALIVASGAKWRRLDVPGESAYHSRGVAYCAHCDGPFYRGRAVAVIGGGNSAVEAVLDLASYARHVTLFYRGDKLTSEHLLQARLKTISNVTMIPHAEIKEILGDQKQVTGVIWKDRRTAQEHYLDMDGVFIKIGLEANSEWLKGQIPLSEDGEILINHAGETEVSGVFAAGDVTIVPYKQIIVAMGEGAKAALAACDYLMRLGS